MPIRKLLIGGLIIVALGCGLAIWQFKPKTTSKVDIKPSSSTDVGRAIAKAQDQLIATLDETSSYQRLILDFLSRRFQLDSSFRAEVTPIKLTSDATQAQYDALKRIAYPSELIKSLPLQNSQENVDYMIMAAANCDHIALPSDFHDNVQQNIEAGNYSLTHAFLSEIFMAENACTLPQNITPQAQIVDQIAAIAGDPKAKPDLRYEAIALLLFAKHRLIVRSEWINWITSQQRPDGGWNQAGDSSPSSDHPTVLALWALLEYTHPDATVPIIRH